MVENRLHSSAAENKFYDIFTARYLITGDPKVVFVLNELVKRVWKASGYSVGHYMSGLKTIMEKLIKTEIITSFQIDREDNRLAVRLTDEFRELVDGSPTAAWSEKMLKVPTPANEAYAIGFKIVAGHYGEVSVPQLASWVGYREVNTKVHKWYKNKMEKPDYYEFSLLSHLDVLVKAGVLKGYTVMYNGKMIYPVDVTNEIFRDCTVVVDVDYTHIQQVSDFCRFGGEPSEQEVSGD